MLLKTTISGRMVAKLCGMVAEAMWDGCEGYMGWLRRLYGMVAEAG